MLPRESQTYDFLVHLLVLVLVEHCTTVWNLMRTGGLFQFMRFVCNLPRIMRLFDFGRNYAKNYASIIRQGLVGAEVCEVAVRGIPDSPGGSRSRVVDCTTYGGLETLIIIIIIIILL